MKNMVMTGMAALCLILGIMAAMGGTWLVPDLDADEKEEMEDMGMDTGTALNYYWMSYDVTVMDLGDCEDMADGAEDEMGGTASCDGDIMTVEMSFSDLCDDSDDDEACDMATGGMIGTIGMWAGVLCALLVALTLILPMAGVDAMDAMPDMGKMITSWGAGGLMLVGILGWWMMLPDGGDMTMGMSSMMAIGAALLGLAAAAMDQFMDADE